MSTKFDAYLAAHPEVVTREGQAALRAQRRVIPHTGVGAILSTSHADRLTGKLHGHSWEVIAWHRCQHENDAVVLQNHLVTLLKTFDHTVLPPQLSRAEDLAAAILKLSPPSCFEVEIRRPLERLYARAR